MSVAQHLSESELRLYVESLEREARMEPGPAKAGNSGFRTLGGRDSSSRGRSSGPMRSRMRSRMGKQVSMYRAVAQ